jgi:hypothetical protein
VQSPLLAHALDIIPLPVQVNMPAGGAETRLIANQVARLTAYRGSFSKMTSPSEFLRMINRGAPPPEG